MMFLRNRIKTDLKNKKQKLDFAVKMKKKKRFPERVYVATQKVQPPVSEFYCLSNSGTLPWPDQSLNLTGCAWRGLMRKITMTPVTTVKEKLQLR